MSATKIVIALVILAALGGGAWYLYSQSKVSAPAPEPSGETAGENQQSAPVDEVAARDSSNESLEQDLASVDASLKASSDESSAMGSSLSDKPVAQTE